MEKNIMIVGVGGQGTVLAAKVLAAAAIAKGEEVVTVTATPNEFYKISTFKVNGKDVVYEENEGSYVYQIVVLGDVEVEVTFENIKYNVDYTISENGTVSVSNVKDAPVFSCISPSAGDFLCSSIIFSQILTKFFLFFPVFPK